MLMNTIEALPENFVRLASQINTACPENLSNLISVCPPPDAMPANVPLPVILPPRIDKASMMEVPIPEP
jgi:hypothetical protein